MSASRLTPERLHSQLLAHTRSPEKAIVEAVAQARCRTGPVPGRGFNADRVPLRLPRPSTPAAALTPSAHCSQADTYSCWAPTAIAGCWA